MKVPYIVRCKIGIRGKDETGIGDAVHASGDKLGRHDSAGADINGGVAFDEGIVIEALVLVLEAGLTSMGIRIPVPAKE
jgi:hypothetical protein